MFGQKRALSAETFCTHFGELHALLLRQRGLAGELFRMFGELQKRPLLRSPFAELVQSLAHGGELLLQPGTTCT
jgi:hypothetical protein